MNPFACPEVQPQGRNPARPKLFIRSPLTTAASNWAHPHSRSRLHPAMEQTDSRWSLALRELLLPSRAMCHWDSTSSNLPNLLPNPGTSLLPALGHHWAAHGNCWLQCTTPLCFPLRSLWHAEAKPSPKPSSAAEKWHLPAPKFTQYPRMQPCHWLETPRRNQELPGTPQQTLNDPYLR